MDEKKLFTDRRWNDDQLPVVVGRRVLTKEERKEAKEKLRKAIKEKHG